MDITELNIGSIYKKTIQTIIDIINDIIIILDNNDNKNMYKNLVNVFIKKERQFYIGIIFIILSFVIYFIDGVSI
jgi:hypothetical protein